MCGCCFQTPLIKRWCMMSTRLLNYTSHFRVHDSCGTVCNCVENSNLIISETLRPQVFIINVNLVFFFLGNCWPGIRLVSSSLRSAGKCATLLIKISFRYPPVLKKNVIDFKRYHNEPPCYIQISVLSKTKSFTADIISSRVMTVNQNDEPSKQCSQ